mgnify:CR=1 FL=1
MTNILFKNILQSFLSFNVILLYSYFSYDHSHKAGLVLQVATDALARSAARMISSPAPAQSGSSTHFLSWASMKSSWTRAAGSGMIDPITGSDEVSVLAPSVGTSVSVVLTPYGPS